MVVELFSEMSCAMDEKGGICCTALKSDPVDLCCSTRQVYRSRVKQHKSTGSHSNAVSADKLPFCIHRT